MKSLTACVLFIGLVQLAPAFAGEGAVSAPNVVTQSAAPATDSQTTAAQGAAAPLAGQPQPGLLGMAMPFLIMLGIMYFLMIRPQQKRMKEHQNLMSGLKKGDQVVTSAGIFGTISDLDEKTVMLDVSKNVSMKVLKSQVNQVLNGPVKDLQ
jgi:preprotein translocase subunit YajC